MINVLDRIEQFEFFTLSELMIFQKLHLLLWHCHVQKMTIASQYIAKRKVKYIIHAKENRIVTIYIMR